MKKAICLLMLCLLGLGCSRAASISYVAGDNGDSPNNGGGNNGGGSSNSSGPVNLDPNIKSMQLGATTYSVVYIDHYFYPDDETGFNPDILIDTFNEDPQFTADQTITLGSGQTEVIFNDAQGDWPPIQVEFY